MWENLVYMICSSSIVSSCALLCTVIPGSAHYYVYLLTFSGLFSAMSRVERPYLATCTIVVVTPKRQIDARSCHPLDLRVEGFPVCVSGSNLLNRTDALLRRHNG